MKKFTNFSFNMCTHIVFGKDTVKQVGNLIKMHGGTKVMFVYGNFIKTSGLYDKIAEYLKEEKIPFVELTGIKPNPRRSLVEKGLKYAQSENVDFMLAVGGGSTIDTAKAIALGLANNGTYWQFFNGEEPKKMIPVGAISTIASSGSETSGSIVLLDDIESNRKIGNMYPICRPVFAIMDPELTYSLPKFQTGLGAADMFAHTFDRYFIDSASFLGDLYCIGTMKTAIKYGSIAVNDPKNYEARAELMLTASFAHNDVTGIGRSGTRKGSSHGLESQLSGIYDTPHGAGIAAVMPAWLDYLVDYGEDVHVSRVAQFAVDVFDVPAMMDDKKATAKEGIRRLRHWLKSLEMPLTLKELGIPKEDLDDIVLKCRSDKDGIQRGFMDLDKKAVRIIFKSILE